MSGDLTPDCTRRAEELYGVICDHLVTVSTPETSTEFVERALNASSKPVRSSSREARSVLDFRGVTREVKPGSVQQL